MTFLEATSFALAGIIPLIVLMYILKLKRKPAVVPSTYLWRKAVEDLRVNAPFQRLRKSLLLLLQILTAAVLIFALARPMLPLKGAEGRAVILLLDISASMKATDVEPNRFESARAAAREMVDEMSPGDQMMIVAFGARARIVCPMTSDRSALAASLDGIRCEDTPTSAREALTIALSVARAQKIPPEIVFLSDGNVPDVADLDLRRDKPGDIGDARINYVIFGSSTRNAGITALEARRRQDATRDFDVFVGLTNYDSAVADLSVEFRLNDSLVDARQVSVAPRTQQSVVFKKSGMQEGVVNVRFSYADDLASDNEAWTALQKEKEVSAMVIGDENQFLLKALNLHQHIKVFKLGSAEFAAAQAGNTVDLTDYDIVVFDNVTPDALDAGNYIFFNSIPPVLGFAVGEEVKNPMILDWDRTHPLLRYVDFSNVTIEKARKLTVPDTTRVICESRQGPFIVAYDREPVRAVITAFDIFSTDWPLRLSFPLFLSNATSWLAWEGGSGEGAHWQTGDVLRLPRSKGTAKFLMQTPAGEEYSIETSVERPAFFGSTETVGLYRCKAAARVENEPAIVTYAVNLTNAAESAIKPSEKLKVGYESVQGKREATVTDKELWHYIALAAFVLLLVEWYVYNRRVMM